MGAEVGFERIMDGVEIDMDELIRRSDAIEALYKYNFVTKEVIEREIMDIPSADRWIPCEERLPEHGEDVLITNEYGDVEIASIEYFLRIPEPWQWEDIYGIQITYTVLAWMPLPEPWKGADDE